MLVLWLPESIDTLPVNASHRVGIGAFVLNSNHEVFNLNSPGVPVHHGTMGTGEVQICVPKACNCSVFLLFHAKGKKTKNPFSSMASTHYVHC